jgi:ABC-type glycerol-3-phosphate transport system substrate-binding protein
VTRVVTEKEIVKETVVVAGTPQVVELEKEVTRVVEKQVVKEVPAAEAKVEIEWWHGWGGTTGIAALANCEKAFNAEDRKVKVNRLQVPAMNDKLLAAIAAGTPPDVGVCCIAYAQYYARGSMTPIDDYVSASTVVNLDDFLPTFVESMTWLGKLYGVPACECGPRFGMLYNRDTLKELGVAEEDLPTTWGEMRQMLPELSRFDAAGNVETVGFDPLGGTANRPPTPNISMFWAEDFGMDVWDEQALEFHFDDGRLDEALALIKEFYDFYGGIGKIQAWSGSFTGGSQSPTGAFPMGGLTTEIYGYWAAGEMPHSSPGMDFYVTWVPVPDDRKGTKCQGTGGHPIYIPTGAKHPDEAWEFMEWITTPVACELIFNATGWFGGRKEYYDANHPWVKDQPALQWYLNSSAEADDTWENPVIPNSGFVNQEWQRVREAVAYGDMPPSQGVAELQENCTKDLRQEFPELF